MNVNFRMIYIMVVLLGFLFCFCYAAEAAEEDYLTPTFVVYDGRLEDVIGGVPGSELIIPEKIDGQTITTIGTSAFEDSVFGSIILPDTVTEIYSYAFYRCSELESITLPEEIISIGNDAFAYCSSLKSITLPDKLTSIDEYAFYKCSALEEITIPEGVKHLNDCMFYDCFSLKSITLKANGVTLGKQVFCGCEALKTINGQLGEIDCDSFGSSYYNAPSLTSIGFDDSVTKIPDCVLSMASLVITVGQDSPLVDVLAEYGNPYCIRETGEVYNVVNCSATSVSEKVEEIVTTLIRPNMSDYEKALALHDWLIMNADYDYTYSNYTASGVLLEGKGVCQSYALAYQLLLNEVGIPNCLEHGKNHVWNMIELDGEWYHVDVTWDDPGEGGFERWDYFCVSNFALEGIRSHECYDQKHISTAYKYNYAYRSGELNERLEECEEAIISNLLAGEWNFDITPGSFEAWEDEDIMRNRTAYLVMQDTSYKINDKKADLAIDYFEIDHYIEDEENEEDEEDEEDVLKIPLITITAGLSEPDMILPASLTTINQQAFTGVNAGVIYIPDGATSIGAMAFADCDALWQIRIPESVKSISETAFEGVDGVCIFGKKSSAAEEFAESKGFGFCPES